MKAKSLMSSLSPELILEDVLHTHSNHMHPIETATRVAHEGFNLDRMHFGDCWVCEERPLGSGRFWVNSPWNLDLEKIPWEGEFTLRSEILE
jgi:hypothetical protein